MTLWDVVKEAALTCPVQDKDRGRRGKPTWNYLCPLHDLNHLLARQAVQRGEQALGRVWFGAVVACIHNFGLDVS